MTAGRIAAAAVALVLAGGAMAVSVRGQGRDDRPAVRAMIAGRGGSEIGVSIRDVEPGAGAKPGESAGVVIDDVTANGPAARAGIMKNDVIVEFDGERVRSARQLARLVEETPAGRKVPAAVTRDGQRVTLTVEPSASNGFSFNLDGELDAARIMRDMRRDLGREFRGALPPTPPVPPDAPHAPGAPAPPPVPPVPEMPDFDRFIYRSDGALGISVTSMSSQLADYFGVTSGVLVTNVKEGSAAAGAGFRAGDVVTAFNGGAVADPGDLRARTERLADGAEFTASVTRDRKSMPLKGKIQRPATARRVTRVSS